MNRGDLVRQISDKVDQPATVVDSVLGACLDVVGEALASGDDVTIRTFGKFEPRRRKAVTRRNPRTGIEINVPEKVSVGFIPSGNLKTRLNAKSNGHRRRKAAKQ